MKLLRKLVSLLLVGTITVTFASGAFISASAATTENVKVSVARVWNGKADKSWFTGKKDTYDISTAEQLAGLAQIINNNEDMMNGITINLTNDIILNDTKNWEDWVKNPPKNKWTPIGKTGNLVSPFCSFQGVFNGNGHTISGMYVNTERNSGLFNYLGGSMIVNLRIEKSVVLGKNAGALAGASENSYIDGVEVRNVHIYGSDVSGGLVGHFTRVTHVVQLLFYTTFLAFAALPNPLYFRDTRDMNYSSYVNNCKVIDSKVSVDGFTWDPRAGGIVGGTWRGAIYNSLSINNTVSSSRHVPLYPAACGAVIGEVDYQGKCVIENCYSYGFKRGDGVELISDKDRVNYISKKTATSSSLVKKLGKGFVAVKNSYPKITTIHNHSVKVALNGSKAKLSWNSVKNAKEYRIYIKNSDGKYEMAAKTTKTSAELKEIKKGSSYSISIRAYFSDGKYEEVSNGKFTFKA